MMENFTYLITTEIVIYDAVLKQQAEVWLVVSGSHLCFFVLKTGGLCWRSLLPWKSLLLKPPTAGAQVSTGPCAPSVPLVDNAEMNDACLSVHGDLITTMEGEWEGFHSNLNIFKKQTGFLLAILPGVLTESSTCKASTFFLFVFFFLLSSFFLWFLWTWAKCIHDAH